MIVGFIYYSGAGSKCLLSLRMHSLSRFATWFSLPALLLGAFVLHAQGSERQRALLNPESYHHYVVQFEADERAATGKLYKKQLRDRYWQGRASRIV